ncbi:hypothetical protein D9619_002603 [Psilocybe cf. subviscida]|uniref:Uncharacterized protein n=1 Tax=Psilocybe cf. subviscida TaxID=2480587 RepID=A0A8H5AX21_9AGAR|nr:hypothetical protein D9619_002603 [Psilocybe cf. subviscida]
MDAGPTLKHKVTVKLSYKPSTTFRPPLADGNVHSRPASPAKNNIYTNPNDSTATFRPKAKVNSSATTRRAAVTSANSVHVGSTGPPSRSASPLKTIPRVKSTLSPKTASSANSSLSVSRTARVPAAVSAPVTPETRRVLPKSSALASHLEGRGHEGSNVSTSHQSTASFSSLHATSSNISSSLASDVSVQPRRLTVSKSVVNLASDRRQTSSPTLRIRSKVTPVAKTASSESAPPTPPLPNSNNNNLYPSSRTFTPRPRAPSSSSNVSQQPTSPPTQFYPITTSVSAANPHRYPSARPPPMARTNPPSFQSFGSPPNGTPSASPVVASQSPGTRPARVINGVAKIDPASIPLPLNSPPASTVSFSSRSSASNSHLSAGQHSRTGSASTDTGGRPSPSAPTDIHATLDNLMKYTSEVHSEDDETTSGLDDVDDTRTEELKVKATAKSNRKIADLEITNRSLMAINMSLEATKHRQAKEIRDLRRKLRETRLILPPRTYAEIKSSDGLADEEVSEEDEEDETSDVDDTHGDEIYKRIKIIIENLLKSGEEALIAPTSIDTDGSRNTTKVLTAAEVNDYHNNGTGELEEQDDNRSVGNNTRRSISPNDEQFEYDSDVPEDEADAYLRTGNDRGNMTMTSEDEVEAMMHEPGRRSLSTTPPILITEPTS